MDELKKLSIYCERFSTTPEPLLLELERETHLKTLAPQMLTGRLQGQFLALISRLKKPMTILEIGTFTGYGALCLAKGLAEGGTLHTIEVNRELSHISKKYFEKAGMGSAIQLHEGNAMDLIPKMENISLDMVYLDSGKHDYFNLYELVLPRMNLGGLLLVDNVLWSGKVLEGLTDKDTLLLNSFNKMVQDDERVQNILLPIRDGILVVEKRA